MWCNLTTVSVKLRRSARQIYFHQTRTHWELGISTSDNSWSKFSTINRGLFSFDDMESEDFSEVVWHPAWFVQRTTNMVRQCAKPRYHTHTQIRKSGTAKTNLHYNTHIIYCQCASKLDLSEFLDSLWRPYIVKYCKSGRDVVVVIKWIGI